MRIHPYNFSRETWLQKWFGGFLAAALLINAGGLFITILEPDGALYASIAKAIARTGDFIDLRAEGRDWLDKPHFPFWMAALSFRVFGLNSFAYKFPAFLFWLAGAWYTYRLALALYGRVVGQLAVLIYVTAAHLVISNNDVRAEPYLTGLVIGAVYHYYRAGVKDPGAGARYGGKHSRVGGHLVAGSLLAACAVMTKGPFVLVTIGAGFILDWVVSGDFRQFVAWRWWIAVALIGVFITPELYCLYRQFDLHPEKTIFGRTGVSGVRWFFWDSQFGRFFNTGPIRGSGDPFFYFHTLLWAFLPWSLVLYAAIVNRFRRMGRAWSGNFGRGAAERDSGMNDVKPGQEERRSDMNDVKRGQEKRGGDGMPSVFGEVRGDWIPLGAAVLSFIMFSLSRFQLPHYLNILFPFFAILVAGWLADLRKRGVLRGVVILQNGIALLLGGMVMVVCGLFHFQQWAAIMGIVLVLTVLPFFLFRGGVGDESRRLMSALGRSLWMALLAYAFVDFCLYPAMLRYQAGSEAAPYVTGPVFMLREAPANYSFEFYCPQPVEWIDIDRVGPEMRGDGAVSDGRTKDRGTLLMFLPSSFEDSLSARGYAVKELRRFPNFHISQLTGEFLNYRTREAALNAFALVRVGY